MLVSSSETGERRRSRFLLRAQCVVILSWVAVDMAPCSSERERPVKVDFKKTCSTDIDGRFPIDIYKSRRTGLTVAVAQVSGPLVTGYLALGEFFMSIRTTIIPRMT